MRGRIAVVGRCSSCSKAQWPLRLQSTGFMKFQKSHSLLFPFRTTGNFMKQLRFQSHYYEEIERNVEEAHFTGMLRDYFLTGDVATCIALYEHMKEQKQIYPTASGYTALISCAAQMKNPELIDKLYTESISRNRGFVAPHIFSPIFSYCRITKDFTRYEKYLKELRSRGTQFSAQLMSTILRMGIENDRTDDLKYYLNCISYEGVQPDTVLYNLMVQSYTKLKDLEGMDDLYDKIISSTDIDILDTNIFNSILNACAEFSDVDRGKFYWNEMVDLGIPPDYFTYAILIKLYSKQHDEKQATKYYKKMMGKGLIPTKSAFNSLIYSARKLPNLALQYFNDMQQHNFVPDISTYICLLLSCQSNGDIDRALLFYNHAIQVLGKENLTSQFFYNLIKVCLFSPNIGRAHADAAKIFDEMMEIIPIPSVENLYLMMAINARCCALKSLQKYLQQFVTHYVNLNRQIANIVIKSCSNLGFNNYAYEIYRVLPDPDRNTYLYLIKSCIPFGLVEDCKRYMAEFMKRSDIFAIDIELFNSLLAVCENAGDATSAEIFYNDLKLEVSPNVGSFVHILKACYIAGDEKRFNAFWQLLNETFPSHNVSLRSIFSVLDYLNVQRKLIK